MRWSRKRERNSSNSKASRVSEKNEPRPAGDESQQSDGQPATGFPLSHSHRGCRGKRRRSLTLVKRSSGAHMSIPHSPPHAEGSVKRKNRSGRPISRKNPLNPSISPNTSSQSPI